jgi:hypothetical protein
MKNICFLISVQVVGLHTMANVNIINLLSENERDNNTPYRIKNKAYLAVFRLISLTIAVFFAVAATAQVERASFLPSPIELNRPFRAV